MCNPQSECLCTSQEAQYRFTNQFYLDYVFHFISTFIGVDLFVRAKYNESSLFKSVYDNSSSIGTIRLMLLNIRNEPGILLSNDTTITTSLFFKKERNTSASNYQIRWLETLESRFKDRITFLSPCQLLISPLLLTLKK